MIRQHSPVAERRLERRGWQHLAADRPVQVGKPEQDELALDAVGALRRQRGRGLDLCHVSPRFTSASTSASAAAKRSIISASSSSVLVYAGASTVWSPA